MVGFAAQPAWRDNSDTKKYLALRDLLVHYLFMTNEPSQLTPADPARNEPSEARTEQCTCCTIPREPDPTDDNLRALRRLRDLAMAMAEKLAGQILDETAPDEPGDTQKPRSRLPATTLAFQRIERAVCQCIQLSNKLHAERLARETQTEAAAAKAEQQRRERRKSRVARLVKEAIELDAEDNDYDSSERLEKLDERIDEEDIESDIGRIADSAIIARLCKDCGVEAPWEDWEGEHWALEEARQKPPGSVYAGSRPAAPPAPEPPQPGPEAVEPVEAKPSQPERPQAKTDQPAADGPKPPDPEPPTPEPDHPHVARMKVALARAMRSGAWMHVLQTDQMLAGYVQTVLNKHS